MFVVVKTNKMCVVNYIIHHKLNLTQKADLRRLKNVNLDCPTLAFSTFWTVTVKIVYFI